MEEILKTEITKLIIGRDNLEPNDFLKKFNDVYTNFRCKGNNVVVRLLNPPVFSGEIIVNIDTRIHRRPNIGMVVSSGCNEYKVGEYLFFTKYAGVNFHLDIGHTVLLNKREIIGRIEERMLEHIHIGDTAFEGTLDNIGEDFNKVYNHED